MACISNYALIVDVLAPVLMRIASPLVVDSLLAFDALPGRRSCPVAHASRVSVSASRRDSLFREVRDDETSSPRRETRAAESANGHSRKSSEIEISLAISTVEDSSITLGIDKIANRAHSEMRVYLA